MPSVQLLSTECINGLIQQKNPFQPIFYYLLNKWSLDLNSNSDFEEKLSTARHETFEFEKLIAERKTGIFPSIYNALIQKCKEESGMIINETLSNTNSCIILMDSLSIREAGIIKETISNEIDSDINFNFSYSSLPSDTKKFEATSIKPNLDKFSNTMRIREISDIERIIPSYPLLILSPFPDIYYHSHSAGYTEIVPIKEIFSKLLTMVKKLIEVTRSFGNYDQIIITSDHGYMDRGAGSFKLTRQQIKSLKDTFGGRRYLQNVPINNKITKLINDQILVSMDGTLVIKGTFAWPIGGKFHQFVHGGISFLECLVPVISLKGD